MQALRQFGLAIAISVISLGLVIGGLSLALSESFTPPPSTATLSQPTAPEIVTTTATPQILPTETSIPTATGTAVPPTSCTPPAGWVAVIVGPFDNLGSLASLYHSTAGELSQANCLLTDSLVVGSILYVPPSPAALPATLAPGATAIPCGAPYGWVRYIVQPGDTLYRIATNYGITTSQLQRSNCLGLSTTIRVGQALWVPNVPPKTPPPPEITALPTFSTPLVVPTDPPTGTTWPPALTPEPGITLTPETPVSQ